MDLNEQFFKGNDEEDLNKMKAENQEMKTRLQRELGGKLVFPEGLDPRTERMVLRNLQRLAKEAQNGETITLYEYIGKPTYTPDQYIEKDAYSHFLTALLDQLKENNVRVIAPDEVDKGELYRYITRKLFKVQVKDVRIPGMMYTFVFDEKNMPGKEDAEESLKNFMDNLFSGDERAGGTALLHKMVLDNEGKKQPMLVAAKRVLAFAKSFEELDLIDLDLEELEKGRSESTASFDFKIQWKGYLGLGEYVNYKGKGSAELVKNAKGNWRIFALEFPGFNFG